MSSPDWIDESLYTAPDELSGTANVIYIYALAIYGQDTVREELREELHDQFPSINVVEDDVQNGVIKVYYYGDEDDIDENKVLQVVKDFDGSARIK